MDTGQRPPPSPPNVCELSEEVAALQRLSFRQELELFREKPNSYACVGRRYPICSCPCCNSWIEESSVLVRVRFP